MTFEVKQFHKNRFVSPKMRGWRKEEVEYRRYYPSHSPLFAMAMMTQFVDTITDSITETKASK